MVLDGNDVWKPCSDFVWDAPLDFTRKPSLLSLYGSELRKLFVKRLRVHDASVEETLEHLSEMAKTDTPNFDPVMSAYHYLEEKVDIGSTSHEVCLKKFDAQALIAIPASGGPVVWKRRSECVWATHSLFHDEKKESILRFKTTLHDKLPRANEVSGFFQKVLSIPDAGLKEVIEEVRCLQSEDFHGDSLAKQMYRCIAALQGSDTHLVRLVNLSCQASEYTLIQCRSSFKDAPLIYVPDGDGGHRWLCPDECVWTKSCLRSKSALGPYYGACGMDDLFRETIGVQDVTLEILVDELCVNSNSLPTVESFQYAKKLIKACSEFGSLLLRDSDLIRQRCWPCRNMAGEMVWESVEEFYTNDNQDLYEMFSSITSFLDFKFEEIRRLKSFLKAVGVRSISGHVDSATSPEAPCSVNDVATKDIQRRARYLYE